MVWRPRAMLATQGRNDEFEPARSALRHTILADRAARASPRGVWDGRGGAEFVASWGCVMGESESTSANRSNARTPKNRSKEIRLPRRRNLFRVLAKYRF